MMGERGLSMVNFARNTGYNSGTISKWLDGKYPGNVESLEHAVRDALENLNRKEQASPALVKLHTAKLIEAHCEYIRQANHLGILYGPAGIGKTSGAQLYVADHPTSRLLTACEWHDDDRAFLRLLWTATETRGWSGGEPRADYLQRIYHGSDRLILIDNAHKFTRRALGSVFDFHDETKAPIMLIANPEIQGRIRANDQWFRRCGRVKNLELGKDGEKLARHLMEFYAPDGGDGLLNLCKQAIRERGHAGSLRKQLSLARALRRADGDYSWEEAFAEAGEDLIKDPDAKK